jgi:type IV fimbrial biogenesis protein FimT
MPSKQRMSGFTMTELVIVMVIVAILAAIGIPSFKYVTTSNRMSSEINLLLGDMQFARSEAIKEGQTVTICSSPNPTSPTPQCTGAAGGATWNTGWIVFLDTNNNQSRDAGEAVLRVQPAFTSTDTLVETSLKFYAATFNRAGYAPTNSTTTLVVELHDSTDNSQWTRCLAITPIGSSTTERYGMGSPVCN